MGVFSKKEAKEETTNSPPAKELLDVVTSLGTIRAHNGVFAIGDTRFFDEHWKGPARMGAQGYCVDFSGDDNERLAGRVTVDYKKDILADDTIRLHVGNIQNANIIREQAERLLQLETHLSAEVTIHPDGASAMTAKDACRANGAGLVAQASTPGMSAFVAEGAISVQAVRGPNGNLKEIRLVL